MKVFAAPVWRIYENGKRKGQPYHAFEHDNPLTAEAQMDELLLNVPTTQEVIIEARKEWQVMEETTWGVNPFGPRLSRGEKLPSYVFSFENFLEAEEAAEDFQSYVNEHVLKLPANVKAKPQKARADRR